MLDRSDVHAPVSDAGVIKMAPKEWLAVPDNPRQRDTEAHARRARHLREPHPTHAMMNMAELPDGRRFKLDGHTRIYLWATGELLLPNSLSVQVWRCASLEHVKQLYSTFNSSKAVETGGDKIVGGLRELGLVFESDLLKKRRYLAALTLDYELMFGQTAARTREPYDYLAYWAPELTLLDSCNGTFKRFHAGTVAAALVTLRRYGPEAVPFWAAYAAGAGQKIGGEMDAVQALDERITLFIKEGRINGRANTVKMIAVSLAAFDRFRRDELYKAGHGSGVKALAPRVMKEWLIAARNKVRSW